MVDWKYESVICVIKRRVVGKLMNEELFSMQHFQIYISSINYFCFNVSPLQEFTTLLHLRGSLHLCISTLLRVSPISTLYISKLWIFDILQFFNFIICFIIFIFFGIFASSYFYTFSLFVSYFCFAFLRFYYILTPQLS